MAPFNKELLEKYIRGNCTDDEEQELLQWLDYNDIDEYAVTESRKKAEKRQEKNWLALTRQIPVLKIGGSFTKLIRKRKLWTAAAVISGLIILGAGLSIWLTGRSLVSYYANFGEIKSVHLPDGTIVILNATSEITLDAGFNKKNRIVYLKGEAFFDVTRHAGKPFTVKAGKLNITALGTSFNVSAFENNSKITVALKSGKVAVENDARNEKKVILKPGEGAVYSENAPEKIRIEHRLDDKEQYAWQKQIIYFHHADLQEVVHKLQRFYGVSIDAHSLENTHWQLSGEYKNETLKNVLESLSFNYGLNYSIEGNKVTLKEK